MNPALRVPLLAAAAASVAALCLYSVALAKADTVTFTLPAGLACPNSTVGIDISDNARVVTRTVTTRNGTIRGILAGTGSDLVFYNPNHPKTRFSLKGNGIANIVTTTANGTTTVTLTGHNIVIYFPSDTLIGGTKVATTRLVVGREVFTIGADGNSTQVSESGDVTDICALLPAD